jgi:carboxyl-terminal processing protease
MKGNTLRQFLVGAILVSACGALGAAAETAITPAKSLDNADSEVIWNLTKPRQAYALGSEITLSLRTNELVQLDCSSGSDGAFDCTVVRGDTLVQMLFFSPDGDLMSRGGSSVIQQRGCIRQAGGLPLLAVATWTLAGEGLKIQFCLETNLDKIHQAYDRAKSGKDGRWSIQLRNSRLLPEPRLTETERLSGFIRLWSETKYNFAFFSKQPNLDWDQVLVEYLPKVQKAESTFEYYRLLRQCLALLHDGHTEAWGPSREAFDQPPIRLAPVNGKAVIVAVALADKIKQPVLKEQLLRAELKVGEEVAEVDGRPVQDIVRQDLYPYISASTTQALELKAIPKLLNGQDKSQVTLTIMDLAGGTRTAVLTRSSHWSFPPLASGRQFQAKELADGILYIHLPSFEGKECVKEFEAVLPRLRSARGLLFDVRHNGGGSSGNGDAIIGYLIDKTFCDSHWKTRQYMPAFRAWGEAEKWYEGKNSIKPRGGQPFRGPVVVLTGPETCSAAEDFVVALHGSGRAKVVGEKTNGSTGQPLMLSLPGGGGARICTKWDTYADGREFVGVGVIPDVEVHPSCEEIAAGKDAVLEAGIRSLKKAMGSDAAAL